MKTREINAPSLSDLPSSLKLIWLGGGCDDELAVVHDDVSTAVGELGGDVLVRVRGCLRLNDDRVGMPSSGGVNADEGFELALGGVQTGGVGGGVRGHSEDELPGCGRSNQRQYLIASAEVCFEPLWGLWVLLSWFENMHLGDATRGGVWGVRPLQNCRKDESELEVLVLRKLGTTRGVFI